MSEALCELYVIGQIRDGHAVPPCKVGISSNARGRLAGFQTAIPFPIDVVATFTVPTRGLALDLESFSHKMLAQLGKHIHGEWFDLCPLRASAVVATLFAAKLAVSISGDELRQAKEAFGITAVLDVWSELEAARKQAPKSIQ